MNSQNQQLVLKIVSGHLQHYSYNISHKIRANTYTFHLLTTYRDTFCNIYEIRFDLNGSTCLTKI